MIECARYSDHVVSTETTPHGHVDFVSHICHPWHGPAARATTRTGAVSYHRNIPAARAWLEATSPRVDGPTRRGFLAAVADAGDTLVPLLGAPPAGPVCVHVATGRLAVDDTPTDEQLSFELRADRVRRDEVLWRFRAHPYWQVRFGLAAFAQEGNQP